MAVPDFGFLLFPAQLKEAKTLCCACRPDTRMGVLEAWLYHGHKALLLVLADDLWMDRTATAAPQTDITQTSGREER